jgi:predicted GNAT family N-acyltransferase
MTKYEVEIEPDLKYTEETGRLQQSLPVRDCFLWKEGEEEAVSGLNLVSFRQRFGALSVPSEGIGGVETVPDFRRQGYMNVLMEKVLEGAAKRVKIVFVSDAIEDAYEKFGFVNCLADAYLSIPVRNVERAAERAAPDDNGGVRDFTDADLPAMVNLYNETHADRPWTHDRADGWNRLLVTRTWRPGSEVVIFERDAGLAGYAILTEQRFGRVISPFVVDELAARDVAAARALLFEVASRCWELRFSDFWVREPPDSMAGRAARALGCAYHQTYPRSGGMMGAILDRQGLLQSLELELKRRMLDDELSALHPTTFDALCQGKIVPDNRTLLRLLLGYWSMHDALAAGAEIPRPYEHVCSRWFPGGGSVSLSMPYNHLLDRY